MAETVTIPVRPPTPQAAPLEPRLTAIQERMARAAQREGGVLVDGSTPPEDIPPTSEAVVAPRPEAVAEQPENDGRTESRQDSIDNLEATVTITEWLGLDIAPAEARAVLEIDSLEASRGILGDKLRGVQSWYAREVAAKRIPIDKAKTEISRYKKTLEIKGGEQAKLERELAKSKNPRDRAIIADFNLHRERTKLKVNEQERDEIQARGGDTSSQDRLIAERTQAIAEQTQSRAAIKDADGNAIPDQISQAVKMAIRDSNVEKILGRKLTPEEINQVETEPLVIFEEILNEVIKSGSAADPLRGIMADPLRGIRAMSTNMVQSGFLTDAQAGEWSSQVSTELTNQKTGTDKMKSLGMGIGGLFLAMAWAAKQREGAAAQGQGGH